MANQSEENRELTSRIEQLEAELNASKKRERVYRSFVENSSDLIYRSDLNGLVTYASPSITKISGFSAEEVVGLDLAKDIYLHPEQRQIFLEKLQRSGFVENFVVQLKRKDGGWWWASISAHMDRDASGKIQGVEGVVRDITEMMEADLELRRIFEMSLDMICVADIHSAEFTKVNTAFTRILGYSELELLGKSCLDLIHPEDVEQTAAIIKKELQQGREVVKFRNRYRCKNGQYRWLSWVSHPLPEIGFTYAIAHDVTDEIEAARALEESEKRFRNIIEASPMGVVLYELKPDGRLVIAGSNSATDRILEIKSQALIGLTIEEAFPALAETGVPEMYKTICREGTMWQAEQVRYDDKNVPRHFEVCGFQTTPGRAAVFFLDISERKKAEGENKKLQEQLTQAQKMEAVGTLAGGIAHDFNNMIGGIMGAADMLSIYLSDDERAGKFLKMILDISKRAAGLTGTLLTFSRTKPSALSTFDVHEIIQEMVVLLENTMDRRIKLDVDLCAGASVVGADPSQLQSGLLNLGINGLQAMPDGGTLSVVTRNLQVDESYCCESTFDLQKGNYLEVEIRDTGFGIEPEVLPRIFDPFFTTKEQGQGTGLGLSTVYGTVVQHGGAVTVESEPGGGTSFRVLLPVASRSEIVKSSVLPVKRGTGKILVIDDEEIMRVTAKAILEELGYKVLLAENGKEGLDIYQQNANIVDLVLLDMVMPVMNGRDCFDALREYDPQVRVVIVSGFSRHDDFEEMMRCGLKGFIRKPYRGAKLSQVVHDVLRG